MPKRKVAILTPQKPSEMKKKEFLLNKQFDNHIYKELHKPYLFNNQIYMNYNFLCLIIALVFFQSCTFREDGPKHEDINKLSSLEWLIGSWIHHQDDGYFSENWTQVNDSVLSGFGYLFLGEDTIFSETISLEQKGEDIFYIVSAQGQNDGKSVQFRLTSDNDGKFVFENPEHDFPKRIMYQFIDNEHFQAVVEGLEAGENRRMVFDFSKK